MTEQSINFKKAREELEKYIRLETLNAPLRLSGMKGLLDALASKPEGEKKKPIEDCHICEGTGFDVNGLACGNCHGLGYGTSPVLDKPSPVLATEEQIQGEAMSEQKIEIEDKIRKLVRQAEFNCEAWDKDRRTTSEYGRIKEGIISSLIKLIGKEEKP
jgi:hypothetical protein